MSDERRGRRDDDVGRRADAAADTRREVRRAEAVRERFDRELDALLAELRELVAQGRDDGAARGGERC